MPSESILSVVRYSDPGFAAEWLCRAFGFAVHRSTDRLEGGLAYVVLRCGDDLVLIASSCDDDLIVEPGEVSKRSTQAYFIPPEEIDAHCATAVQAGAAIEISPRDKDGGRYYVCRDPGGHLWVFGQPPPSIMLEVSRRDGGWRRSRSAKYLIAAAVLVVAAVGTGIALHSAEHPVAKSFTDLLASAFQPETAPPAALPNPATPMAWQRLTEQQVDEEKQRRAAEAAQKAEEERQRQAAEGAQKAEQERQRQAAEAAQKAEQERQRQVAEAAQKAEQERQRQAAEAAQKAEQERQRQAAEAAQKAEQERQRQVAEAAQKAEEERKRQAAEAAQKAEQERQRQAAEAAQKAEQERQRQAAEAAQKAEQERQRQAAEAAQKAEERQRQVAEAAEAARRADEERQRQVAESARLVEEERQRKLAEAARQAEVERQRKAAEAAQKAEQERQRQAAEAAQKAEEERQRQAAEAARKAEEERKRQAAEAAQRAEEERQRQAAEAARKAEDERQQLATAEAARIANEAAETKARTDQENSRRTLGFTVTPEDGARFLKRGRALLSTGDVTSARLFLERASNAGIAEAAMELAETYDPAMLTRLNVVGLAGNREQAKAWYLRAQVLGSSAAAERLKSLGGQ